MSFSVLGQEVKIGSIENKIVIGDLAGNRDFGFGVKNVLEEVLQDLGYDLNPSSNTEISVDLLFFDIQKTNMQLGVYGKNTDTYLLAASASLLENGKLVRTVTAKGTAKSVSTATLIIDEGGKFSQANVSTAIKKLCEDLIKKLKI
jgi:uncharacterized lipoprotein YajG